MPSKATQDCGLLSFTTHKNTAGTDDRRAAHLVTPSVEQSRLNPLSANHTKRLGPQSRVSRHRCTHIPAPPPHPCGRMCGHIWGRWTQRAPVWSQPAAQSHLASLKCTRCRHTGMQRNGPPDPNRERRGTLQPSQRQPGRPPSHKHRSQPQTYSAGAEVRDDNFPMGTAPVTAQDQGLSQKCT